MEGHFSLAIGGHRNFFLRIILSNEHQFLFRLRNILFIGKSHGQHGVRLIRLQITGAQRLAERQHNDKQSGISETVHKHSL